MMNKVSDLSFRDPILVHPEDGINRIKNIAILNNNYYFPVVENSQLLGIITLRDLMTAPPNRIVADVLSKQYATINYDDFLWTAKENFNVSTSEVLVVKIEGQIAGLITEVEVDIALARHVDSLTGLYKSNYIYYYSSRLFLENKHISFIFLDINQFGLIDKKYGHVIGDQILQETALVLHQNTPPDSYLCRYAGDEFLLLTPYSINDSVLLSKELIRVISHHIFPNKIRISLTAGISGGDILYVKNSSIVDIVEKLINSASLASSKAKFQKRDYLIAENFSIFDSDEMII